VVGVTGVTILLFSMFNVYVQTYKRVVVSLYADVARGANVVDTCLINPSTTSRAIDDAR